MQPVIIRYAESIAETVMLNSANDAVINVLKNENKKPKKANASLGFLVRVTGLEPARVSASS